MLRWRGLYIVFIPLVVIATAVLVRTFWGLDHERRGRRPGRVIHDVPPSLVVGALGIGVGVRKLVTDRRAFQEWSARDHGVSRAARRRPPINVSAGQGPSLVAGVGFEPTTSGL